MNQCDERTRDGQCVYVEGHSGEHLFPTERRDYTDEIRLKVVQDGCERRIAEARAEERRHWERSVVELMIPLEVLNSQIDVKLYRELTRDLQKDIKIAVGIGRAALRARGGKP